MGSARESFWMVIIVVEGLPAVAVVLVAMRREASDLPQALGEGGRIAGEGDADVAGPGRR